MHNEVVETVKLANEYNIMLICFAGGNSVSESVSCPNIDDSCESGTVG